MSAWSLLGDRMRPGAVDWHNHLQSLTGQELPAVIDGYRQRGVKHGVVNATREEDWPVVADLARTYPGWVVPCFGVHPWYLQDLRSGWLLRLRELLLEFPDAGVGEVGVDGCENRAPMVLQMEVWLEQMRLARELQRVACVHAVRAWGEVQRAMRNERFGRVLFHDFHGSVEMMRQLAGHEVWFSCGKRVLNRHSDRWERMVRAIPDDRFLMESDSSEADAPERFSTIVAGYTTLRLADAN